jgi:hypothetical protein
VSLLQIVVSRFSYKVLHIVNMSVVMLIRLKGYPSCNVVAM